MKNAACLVLLLCLASCSSSPAKTSVVPGTSSASGTSSEILPSSSKKSRTVIRVRPVPRPPCKEMPQ